MSWHGSESILRSTVCLIWMGHTTCLYNSPYCGLVMTWHQAHTAVYSISDMDWTGHMSIALPKMWSALWLPPRYLVTSEVQCVQYGLDWIYVHCIAQDVICPVNTSQVLGYLLSTVYMIWIGLDICPLHVRSSRTLAVSRKLAVSRDRSTWGWAQRC